LRRSAGLGATCALLALAFAGCGNGKVIGSGPQPTASPVTPNVSFEYKVPTANAQPTDIIMGADGLLYFTEKGASQIGQMTTGGVFKEFPTVAANAAPTGILLGPNNQIWFTEPGASSIATLVSGKVTEYATGAGSAPQYLANAPQQSTMVFTDSGRNAIGTITTGGVISGPFAVPTANAGVSEIAIGPDQNMWFCETTASKIGHFNTLTNTVDQEFALPAGATPIDIIQGADRAMWFTENYATGPKLGHLTTNGTFSEYPLSGAKSVAGLYLALDGNIYIADPGNNAIGQFAVNTGDYKEFPVKTASSGVNMIRVGPDGRLYFTETAANQIGQFTYF
jgi:virginiamycin B lyase